MTEHEEKKAEEMFQSFQKNYTQEDVEKINSKINGYNKGPLAKIWDKILILWEIMKDPAAAKGAKAIAIAALLYVVSPIDAIPDIIPGLGLIDDAGIVGLAIKMLMDEIKKRESPDRH